MKATQPVRKWNERPTLGRLQSTAALRLVTACLGLQAGVLSAQPDTPQHAFQGGPWLLWLLGFAPGLAGGILWTSLRGRKRRREHDRLRRKSQADTRQALDALRESETKFRLLFENSADSILIIDPESMAIIDCNEAAVTISRGGSREWLLSHTVPELAPDRQPDGTPSNVQFEQLVHRALNEGTQRFEAAARRFNGEEFPIEVSLSPLQLGDRRLLVSVARDISGRKLAENEIRRLNQSLEQRIAERTAELTASEAQLRTLVENAPEAIVVLDGDTGRFESFNANACRLYGLSPEQLKELTPADVSPPRQLDGRTSTEVAAEKIRQALDGRTPVFEWLHRHADGQVFPCEVRLVRLPAPNQRLLRASITDNRERKRRETIQQATYQISEAVHATDDLQSLYERIHTIIKGLMAADNFYLALHDPLTNLFHYAYQVDEMDPSPPARPMDAGLNGYVLRTCKALLADRRSQTDPGSTWHLESGTPSAIWLGVPLVVRGRTLGIMAVQDYHNPNAYGEQEKQILTFVAEQIALAIERKRAEQALRESEEKFRALFEASSQGVMLHDEEKFLEVNPAAVRILGFNSTGEIIGKHPAQTSAPIQSDGEPAETLAKRHIAECMERGTARFEWLSRNPKGRDIPLEVILTRVQMGGRQIMQAVINDITERKNAEAELLKALAREKELSQLKSNFISMVSHEFRTPLGVILSSAEILDSYLDRLPPEERREHLVSIQKNTRRIANLMEEVLLLGRVEAGKMNFHPVPLGLDLFCRRIIDEVQSATDHRCDIALEGTPNPATCAADERLLRHILTNLLTNAVKYSPPGGTARLEITREGCSAVFRISDQGIGIPEPDMPWLFMPFHRGRNVGHRPGTGLGLVIVKRCVDLHGGKISVSSVVDRGTTFTLSLPVYTPVPDSLYEKNLAHRG